MFVFKHPKYYKGIKFELNKSDQAISNPRATAGDGSVRPGPGPKQQASSLKPQASSSLILEPRKSFTAPEPRCSMQMKVLLGWRMWNAIWCGEKRTLLPFVTFNSTVKKWPEVL